MRILHIEVGGYYGGSLRALENYLTCSDRSRLEHDFLIYLPTPGVERLLPLVNNFRIRFPALSPSPTTRNDRVYFSTWRRRLLGNRHQIPFLRETILWCSMVHLYLKARRLALEFGADEYDLVHVNNSFSYNVEALIAARCAGIPAVGHARSLIENSLFNKWALQMTCGVATVNQRLQKQLSSWAPKLPVQTCYDGVALARVDQDRVRELRNTLLGFHGSMICSVGRLDQQKGYAYLVQAARRVLDTRSDVSFVIAGDGPYRFDLERQITESRLTDRFHLLGFRQDVQNVIAASDLLVSPSLREGGPIVAVEAIMLGKPIVLTDLGICREIVIEGKNGYIVPAADVSALTKGILTALENLPVLTEGAKTAGPTLTTPMDVHTSARVLDDFFERVASDKRE